MLRRSVSRPGYCCTAILPTSRIRFRRRWRDAGNASYWFRRVGEHPLLRQLGTVLESWCAELGAGAGELAVVRDLVRGGRLDPFRLIQLSTESPGFPASCAERALRLVQHLEMLSLLLWDVV